MSSKTSLSLFEPHSTITNLAERRRAKAAAALCFFWALVAAATFPMMMKVANPTGLKINAITIVLMAIAYGIARTRFHMIGAWICVLTIFLGYAVRPFVIENHSPQHVATMLLYMSLASPAAIMLIAGRKAQIFIILNTCAVWFISFVFVAGDNEAVQRFLIAVRVVNISLLISMSIQTYFYNYEAKEEASASSYRALSELASSVAHSVNSPLSTVSGSINRMRSILQNESGLTQISQEALSRLGRGLKRSVILVSALKDYISPSHTHSSRVNLTEELTSARLVFGSLARVIEDSTPKSAEIRAVYVTGDIERIKNAIMLLLSYLVRVSESDATKIISAETSPNASHTGCIIICGPEVQSINTFLQDGAQTFRSQRGIEKGSDIELIMIGEIIKKSGGFISYKTEDNKGKFILSWPLV